MTSGAPDFWMKGKYIELIDEITEITRIVTIALIQAIESIGDLTIKGSEGVALQQQAAGAGAWVSPNTHSDPDAQWADEAKAYDGDTGLYAYYMYPNWLGWIPYLILNLPASTKSDKLRFWVTASATVSQIDIDVEKDGVWHNVYQGEVEAGEWIEKNFTQGNVAKVRIKFLKGAAGEHCRIHEVDVWQVPTTGGELLVKTV